MSQCPSYESRIADLKLKRVVSHHQSTRENRGPCSTDNDPVSPSHTEITKPSAVNLFKGLKLDQAGMICGTMLGRVQDDSVAHPEELEDYRLNEKVEILDEDEQWIGPAPAYGTSAGTMFRSVREHPFYKLKPDHTGKYHCPYTSLEDCGYRPQKLKSKFEEHLDTHLKPYRCCFGNCVDTSFSSAGCLVRHEREAHDMHTRASKPYIVHSRNDMDSSEDVTTSSFSKSPPNRDAATHRKHDSSKTLHVRSFQDPEHFLYGNLGDEGYVSERVDGVRTSAPPAATYGKTASLGSNDNVGKKGFGFFDTPVEPKYTTTSRPRYNPKFTNIPTNINYERLDDKKNVVVDVDFLHQLESKISELQSRVEECEARPGSPVSSSISDSQYSADSVSDLDRRSIREARDSRDFDDGIIIFEPEVKTRKRDAVSVEGPSLRIARWKCFGEMPRIEAVDEGMSSCQVDDDLGDKPLLALTEEYCSNGKLWRKRLEIASLAFYELLKKVSCHNLNDIALQEEVFHLTEPFMVLFLNRKQLADYVENTHEYTHAKEHAKFILAFLERDFSDTSRMLDNFESVTPPNLVKYCDLWMLYRPGTTVYSRANGEWEAFVIDSLDGMQVRKPSSDNSHALTRLDIRAWSMNFDGEVYGRVWSIHCVAPFHGVRDISSLPLVPEKFLQDGKEIRESLLSRGKKFCMLQVQHCQAINNSPLQSTRVMVDHLTYQRRNGWLISIDGKYGPSSAKDRSWTDNRYSDWDTSSEAFDRRPRRYTPQRTLVRHFEEEYCNRDYVLESIDTPEDTQAEPCRSYWTDRPLHVVVCEFEKYNLIQPGAEMDEFSLILCPQHVRAFCLRDQVWKFCNVSQLEPVSFEENAWDRLILDEEYKDIVETMVSSHVDKVSGLSGPAAANGLSILLHGEPGVGKTLTAGSIAEHFGRPLFPVTCSDIGTSFAKFDEKLEEISDYATQWGAILLFDEADVLLQARRDYECSNLRRNDLVSSFARFIQYHQGIVFITTNRVTNFDTALMPRIDITLGLPPLDRGRRASIWHNLIQDLFDDGTINASQSDDLRLLAQDKWSKDDINGHQIKKAVQNAKIVAEKKGKRLGHREIDMMLKMEREFQERVSYLDKEKEREKKAGGKNDSRDLEGFEQVEKP